MHIQWFVAVEGLSHRRSWTMDCQDLSLMLTSPFTTHRFLIVSIDDKEIKYYSTEVFIKIGTNSVRSMKKGLLESDCSASFKSMT